nr:immunoglobulin light chain junction region [Macaca mulatta]
DYYCMIWHNNGWLS